MSALRKYRLLPPLLSGCLMLILMIAGSQVMASPETPNIISRPADPAVLTGADFPDLLNTPIVSLAIYAYDGADWQTVPFQVDEVNSLGGYVATGEDDDDANQAMLDANDEVVFMANDAGNATSCLNSQELIPTTHERHAVVVQNPLTMQAGVVYLFTDLPAATDSYVTWDQAAQTATGSYGSSYELTYGSTNTTPFFGFDTLKVNDSIDILDRQKVRLEFFARAFPPLCFGGTDERNEETLTQFISPVITPTIVGPVRLVSGDSDGDFASYTYGSRFDFGVVVDPADLEDGVDTICPGSLSVNYIRSSLDFNDPATTGMSHYFDSETPGGATIDGMQDAGLPAANQIDWFQVNDDGMFGGIAVAFPEVDPGTGTLENVYLDGTTLGDGADTGDGMTFGDSGQSVTDSGRSRAQLSLTAYVLPTGTSASVGATYFEYATNPVEATATMESCSVVTTAVDFNSAESQTQNPAVLLLIAAATMLTGVALQMRKAES